jgi:hypothetical protein
MTTVSSNAWRVSLLIVLSCLPLLSSQCTTGGDCGYEPHSNTFTDTILAPLPRDSMKLWIFQNNYHGDSAVYKIVASTGLTDSVRITLTIKGEDLLTTRITNDNFFQLHGDTVEVWTFYGSTVQNEIRQQTNSIVKAGGPDSVLCTPLAERFTIDTAIITVPANKHIRFLEPNGWQRIP